MRPKYLTKEQKRTLLIIESGVKQARAAAKLAEEAAALVEGTDAELKIRAALDAARTGKNLFADAFEAIQEHAIEMRCLRHESDGDCGEEDE